MTESAKIALAAEIMESMPVTAIRFAKNGDGWEIVYVSGSIEKYGYEPEDFFGGGLLFTDIVHPDDAALVEKSLAYMETEEQFRMDYHIAGRENERVSVVDFNIVGRDEAGSPVTCDKLIIMGADFERQFDTTYYDYLTGLPNRFKCLTDLDKAIVAAAAKEKEGCFLFIDLDDFQVINDCYGHNYGDAMLKAFANYLQDVFYAPNQVYRFGGDEFAVIVSHEMYEQVEGYLKGLVEKAKEPWKVLDRAFYCTVSVGVANFPDAQGGPGAILKHADAAMGEAKRLGKNEFVYYQGALGEDTKEMTRMEALLRRAMENDFEGFEVYYQPVISTEAGEMRGAEALIRMIDGDQVILPGEFLDMAEDFGFIGAIGDFVLRTAAAQCKKINDMGFRDFFMTVNFSARQFGRKDIIPHLESLFQTVGVNCANMVISVNDKDANLREERLIRICEKLKELGVQIALDDFGSGNTPVMHLKDLPADIIKTSVELMEDIEDRYACRLAGMIVEMCRDCGKIAVINGVENKMQYQFCSEVQADAMQGFYMFVPGDAECLERLL